MPINRPSDLADGSVDRASNWWTSAEFDQAVATIALDQHPCARYLEGSYPCWLERFADERQGEVWLFVPERGEPPKPPAKRFHWKSGYHSTEHALVALITTAALRGEQVSLHYAFPSPPEPARIQPYLSRGTIVSRMAWRCRENHLQGHWHAP